MIISSVSSYIFCLFYTLSSVLLFLFLLLPEVVSVQPVLKPVPKPRKALDQLDKTDKEKVNRGSSDDSDRASVSAHANPQSEPRERRAEETRSSDSLADGSEGHSEKDGEDGNLTTQTRNPVKGC